MDYTNEQLELLNVAGTIAFGAHQQQRDKAGEPYIYHPLRVMLAVNSFDEKIVGLLHDVVEDTTWDLETLKELGIPKHILEAVDAISKRKGRETNREYILRCKQNEIAKRVKLADIADNMSPIRQCKLDPEMQKSLMGKYRKDLVLMELTEEELEELIKLHKAKATADMLRQLEEEREKTKK